MALTLTILHLVTLVIAAVAFVGAAISDARSYRIPNNLCLLLIVLFPVFAFSAPHALLWPQHLVVFACVALAGFGAFLAKFMGAGDIKLIAASSLWAGPQFIALFLMVTAFAGGIESLAFLLSRRTASAPQLEWKKTQIPYGIAISTGGIVMLGMMAKPLFSAS